MKIQFTKDISETTQKGMVKDLPFGVAKIFIESGRAVVYNGIESARALKDKQQQRVDEVIAEANLEPATEPVKSKRSTRTKKTK